MAFVEFLSATIIIQFILANPRSFPALRYLFSQNYAYVKKDFKNNERAPPRDATTSNPFSEKWTSSMGLTLQHIFIYFQKCLFSIKSVEI